ncbi:MAG TPA: (2Fe-2S) ferredoxin domain-containing protein [Thermoanaerobaculia bacterium]|nr:(2Fe-2S) ferredoxin domain-containing protein [Thermoanaerobaculia bacterium]
MKYPFETLFLICTGARCNDAKHGNERGELIREELKAHNKTLGRKATVRICAVSCLDLCEHGPNIVVQPCGTTYSAMNRERGRAVYDAETGDGPKRPDLELEL